jgi:hypothetical protein
MKTLTDGQIKEAMQKAYDLGWKDRTSYHDQGQTYWANVTRKQHAAIIEDNKNKIFEMIIEGL